MQRMPLSYNTFWKLYKSKFENLTTKSLKGWNVTNASRKANVVPPVGLLFLTLLFYKKNIYLFFGIIPFIILRIVKNFSFVCLIGVKIWLYVLLYFLTGNICHLQMRRELTNNILKSFFNSIKNNQEVWYINFSRVVNFYFIY